MLSPFFVDAMLSLALVLSCLLATLIITKADLLVLINRNGSDLQFLLTFPLMAIGMTFVYMTLTRIFLGASLGELVFDVQLGTSEQRQNLQYCFQVVLRGFAAPLTGYILLPIISLLVRKDYLGSLSGLRIYRKKR
jgi:hypothetical protein